MPRAPQHVYKNKGWVSMGDWLGTGTVAPHLRKFRSFNQARKFARGLGLKSEKYWRLFSKSPGMPNDIPVTPNQVYRDKGWRGMGDWLGTGNI